jgi:hypothetical protein
MAREKAPWASLLGEVMGEMGRATATTTVESTLDVPGDSVRARDLQTRTSLTIEKGRLPSHQLH